jgi:hypothetical protein
LLQVLFVGENEYSCSESEKELFKAGDGGEEEEVGAAGNEKAGEDQEKAKINRRKRARKDYV